MANKTFVELLIDLNAEVGSINDKIAEWVGNNVARIDNNHLVFNTSDAEVRDAYLVGLKENLCGCLRSIAGFANIVDLGDVAYNNLADGYNATTKCEEQEYEMVEHPNHYNTYDVETIDMMRRIWGDDAVALWCKLTAFKYRMRLGTKPNNSIEQDLKKEKFYLEYASKLEQEEKPNNKPLLCD